MNGSICLLVFAAAALGFCVAPAAADAAFEFKETSPTAIALSEGGRPVYVYNFGMTLAKGFPESMRRAAYLHPVYAPDGTVLTDDFNPNHAHHRGIFWAWPEITVDGKKDDIWTVKGFQERFVRWIAKEASADRARLAVENGWYDGDRKFVKEQVEIVAHPADGNRQALDFTLSFEAVSDPVTIVGTPDQKKGFGGFAMRFATPDGGGSKTIITTDEGVSPKDGVMARHSWAQISGIYHGKAAGARVEDDPTNPGYPRNGWLMRHELCCLNVSYPGLEPLVLQPGKPLILKYRVILFAGEKPN
ncbi:MAG TPA: DUF6807 family protein [Chthonomonadaceae bacterium]|nr:DUF6807 family protein [Chthonomonadaceae bacterium]